MQQYKGYYIDHVIFHSKADIDAHIKAQTIKAYINALACFYRHMSMEASLYCDEIAQRLIGLGMTWEEIDAIEP